MYNTYKMKKKICIVVVFSICLHEKTNVCFVCGLAMNAQKQRTEQHIKRYNNNHNKHLKSSTQENETKMQNAKMPQMRQSKIICTEIY